jgi:hypothetical protein
MPWGPERLEHSQGVPKTSQGTVARPYDPNRARTTSLNPLMDYQWMPEEFE